MASAVALTEAEAAAKADVSKVLNALKDDVRAAFAKDIECNQRDLIFALKAKHGSGLSFKVMKQLKEAFQANKFDTVADKVLAKIGKARQKKAVAAARSGGRPGRPRKDGSAPAARKVSKKKKKVAGKVGRPAKKKRGRPAKVATEATATAAPAKVRGERRDRPVARGRRKADNLLVAFDSTPNHLVVVFSEGAVEDFRFKSRQDAEVKVKQLLAAGHAPARIAYYKKQELTVQVSV